MAYDAGLSARLDELVDGRPGLERKKMFGGIGWLDHGNMCVGVWRDWLIIRVGVDAAPALLVRDGLKPMDITGKPMKGWLMADGDAIAEDDDLRDLVQAALNFTATLPPK